MIASSPRARPAVRGRPAGQRVWSFLLSAGFLLAALPAHADSVVNLKLNGHLEYNEDVWRFKISPDGHEVVYLAGDTTSEMPMRLYRVEIDGGPPVRLDLPQLPWVDRFAISPDSSRVVYHAPDYTTAGAQREFDHDEGNIDLELYNNSGDLLRSSESHTDNEGLEYELTAGGEYFIHVYGNNTAQEYDLWWQRVPSGPDGPYEYYSGQLGGLFHTNVFDPIE